MRLQEECKTMMDSIEREQAKIVHLKEVVHVEEVPTLTMNERAKRTCELS